MMGFLFCNTLSNPCVDNTQKRIKGSVDKAKMERAHCAVVFWNRSMILSTNTRPPVCKHYVSSFPTRCIVLLYYLLRCYINYTTLASWNYNPKSTLGKAFSFAGCSGYNNAIITFPFTASNFSSPNNHGLNEFLPTSTIFLAHQDVSSHQNAPSKCLSLDRETITLLSIYISAVNCNWRCIALYEDLLASSALPDRGDIDL